MKPTITPVPSPNRLPEKRNAQGRSRQAKRGSRLCAYVSEAELP